MTEEKKIKIGKAANVLSTILFVIFIIVEFVGINISKEAFIIATIVILVLFVICCIVSHICLKDYKPQ